MFKPFVWHEDMKSSTVVLSNSGHDHLRNSVVLFRKNVAQFKRGRSKRLSHLLFIAPRGMNFGRFARRPFDGGSASCEHVSTTYGVEPVRGYWRVRRGTTSVADQFVRRSHSTHTAPPLFLHHMESVICSKNIVTCTDQVTPRVTLHTRGVSQPWADDGSFFCFVCCMEKPQPRVWTWDNER